MDFGKVEYIFSSVRQDDLQHPAKVKLTLIGQGDEDILKSEGLAALRRRRILRLTQEAKRQGTLLSYEDLIALLLTSFATLKRDVVFLERHGHQISIRRRKKNGSSGHGTDSNCNGCSHCNGSGTEL